MSALEWLDAVRADLDAATPGPWTATTYEATMNDRNEYRFGATDRPQVFRAVMRRADAALIDNAPDRLDRMERALRAVIDRHRRSGCREPWDTCPTVAAIGEALA